MALSKGQKVAACVPYEDNTDEWIMAEVVSHHSTPGPLTFYLRCPAYVVKDLFPESKSTVRSWCVTPGRVIALPGPSSFDAGDAVLALWFLPEDEEWSTMFYPGVVVRPSHECKEGFVQIQYAGSDEAFDVDVDRVVLQPEPPADPSTQGAIEIMRSNKRRLVPDQYTSSVGLSDVEITRRALYTYHMCGVLGKKIRRRDTSAGDRRASARST